MQINIHIQIFTQRIFRWTQNFLMIFLELRGLSLLCSEIFSYLRSLEVFNRIMSFFDRQHLLLELHTQTGKKNKSLCRISLFFCLTVSISQIDLQLRKTIKVRNLKSRDMILQNHPVLWPFPFNCAILRFKNMYKLLRVTYAESTFQENYFECYKLQIWDL